MNLRGTWAKPIDPTSKKLNVTSAQGKLNVDRLSFSPMTPIEGGYKGYWNFESYWQSGKVFEGIPEEKTKSYWKNLKEPKRRYPGSKGKTVLYANFDNYKYLDYISSRKLIYVPEYFELKKNDKNLQKWKDIYNSGQNITIYDFDGPRNKDGEPICLEVDLNLLKNKINDPSFPFGHGYVVASLIMGINYENYIL